MARSGSCGGESEVHQGLLGSCFKARTITEELSGLSAKWTKIGEIASPNDKIVIVTPFLPSWRV